MIKKYPDNIHYLPRSGRNIVVAVAADLFDFVVSKALGHFQNSLNHDLVQS